MAARRFTQGLVALATIAAASVAGAQDRAEEGSLLLDRAFIGLDADQDGRIERSEAMTQLNMLVGAVFFRADADGDGVVSADEAREASASMPALSRVLGALTGQMSGESLDALEARIGVTWGESISAAQAREATERAVDALFGAVDEDGDGTISPRELHEGAAAFAERMATSAFEKADANGSGTLDASEFEAAMLVPARAAFAAADENEDGELSPEEAQAATALLGSWVSLVPAAAGQPQGTSPELERRMRERMRPEGRGREPR
ncbi:EF-hand domain-containing protein [Polyangium jinanense]|uniref:EF-hand domain-containing protein n=1 Tax=Polyangium jinanense TaxID=2829994 RepID=A0A9X4ARQ2_9BACT|nr:EF-hand domain-containing protein [Polyangium jinanense]MDC3955652.1 EF-hand domain-containing protein [Polyangium jinanense]MDC3982294.1 EF-hand domain-containing protein [Polyangium jinanense]